MRGAAVVLVALCLAGCANVPVVGTLGGGLANIIKELGKDPASICAFVGTPYGPVLIARANTPGIRVVVANGTCTITRAADDAE